MSGNNHSEMQMISATVVDAFQETVSQFGDRTAVTCGRDKLSYNQLHERSDRLAMRLRIEGVGDGDLVAIDCNRCPDMIVALVGVIKAGAAYVPFDRSYPEKRLLEMASVAPVKFALGAHPVFKALRVPSLNYTEFLSEEVAKKAQAKGVGKGISESSLAYVMFTSGSTGKPKAVAVPHGGIMRLVKGQDYCRLDHNQKILQHSPLAFDASTFEVWGALLNGGQLVLFPEETVSLRRLGQVMRDSEITTMWLTSGLFSAMIEERLADFAGLEQLLTGGDVVSPKHAEKILTEYPGIRLVNGYGPTENTTFTCCHQITLADAESSKAIPIGKPINGTGVCVVDENLKPVKRGDSGELCAYGNGLALGYLDRPDLTKEAFVKAPWDDSLILYRTGDRVSERSDHVIEFWGRIDQQVKIRGYRIEIGEIESVIAEIEGIQNVTVVAEAGAEGADKTLVAHYSADSEISRELIMERLGAVLPDHCVPRIYNQMADLPLNANGKVDRLSLPNLTKLTANKASGIEPMDAMELVDPINIIFADILEVNNLSNRVNFFDLGASSLQIARAHEQIQNRLDKEFPITDFFKFPTISQLAKHLSKLDSGSKKSASGPANRDIREDAIAIVGMSGRFPGAPDIDTFWDNLIEARETISHFTKDELDFENAEIAGAKPNQTYVRSRGIVEDSDQFDAAHFNITPKEALQLDPQHRLMLECAQTALEDAGCDPDRFDGKIGVFCGSSQNAYLLSNICQSETGKAQQLAAGYPTNNFEAVLGNDKDFLPTRIAYKLNLNGPAVSIQCACSTSLVAVAQACDSLRSGHSDMALAGGVSLGFPQKRDYLYTEDGIASKDGHCRTFDADATGTVFGEGVGMVALRRLDDAIADGDQIVAVIRGYAMNNDGNDKAGYTAPSINGQSEVIKRAQMAADVSAESIGYIEAHGTATPLGDPIEIAALSDAFAHSTDKQNFCYIGTGKTNVGHLDIAAGITGLIKTALTVQKGRIPKLLNFNKPNPNIDFDNSPFIPTKQLTEWTAEADQPRRAGVSAFGVGGTNVHMIIEQAPQVVESARCDVATNSSHGKAVLCPVSASSSEALVQSVAQLAEYAKQHPDADLAALSQSLKTGRREYSERAIFTAQDLGDLASKAQDFKGRFFKAGDYERVAMMFPGQGSQHPGMAKELYQTESVFKTALDRCFEIVKDTHNIDLREVIFPTGLSCEEAAKKLNHTSLAQPAIFSIEYALAQQWRHWGITPACMIGHSIGEFAAACFAGVFELEDALYLICVRGELMANLPGGSMVSVRATEEQVTPYLNDVVNLAAINGITACVLSGPTRETEIVRGKLTEAGLENKLLHTSHAFHSSMMDCIVDEFKKEVSKLQLNAPEIPILSTVTGKWLSHSEATDANYWATHLRKPVRFFDAMRVIWETKSNHILLESGPGQTLATLAKQNPQSKSVHPALASLPHPSKQVSSYEHIRNTLGSLWCHGLPLDWQLCEEPSMANSSRLSLPSYPFQRKRYWIEPVVQSANQSCGISLPVQETVAAPTPVAATAAEPVNPSVEIKAALKDVLSELSGFEPESMDNQASFLELGFDSLLLTQVGKEIQDNFGVKVSLRELIDEFSTIDELSAHLVGNVDPSKFVPQVPVENACSSALATTGPIGSPITTIPGNGMSVMVPISAGEGQPPVLTPFNLVPMNQLATTAPATVQTQAKEAPKKPAPISGPATVINREKSDQNLTTAQQSHLDGLIERYTKKTAQSKLLTQKYRKVHADPRTASGFNREWKEMVYQIITTKSKGSRLLDIDDNEYIDILNGFGPGFLGHSADFLIEAVEQQLHKGYEVGPQSLLALEAAELFCKVTGNDRTSFVCTGSEAVQAAMRLARTVTKRDKIVIFARDYHGNFDEVLVRGVNSKGNFKSLPSAPGIPKSATGNVIVLPYGTEESLSIIKSMADDLAAVIVEPVQSRRPEFRPVEFIREVREVTEQSGALFIFDEVVTGFRFGPRGAQAYYGVDADLCTYGKVIGGEMPLGVVSGKAEYMDTFDGGLWQYGDDSFPEQPVTFFAGTFVRHPLAMASVKAMLEFFDKQPAHFWNQVNAKGDRLAGEVNQFFAENQLPMEMPNCGSLMFVRMGDDQKYGNLFFYHLREKGVFMLEGFPSYMTAAHCDEDIDYVVDAFKESAFEMQSVGFFDESEQSKGFKGSKLKGPKEKIKAEDFEDYQVCLEPLRVTTTEPQREIILASRLDEAASCAFNESASLRFKGELNVTALKTAFNEVVERHDALRSTFSKDGSTMVVHPKSSYSFSEVDLRDEDPNALKALLEQDASTPYDLEQGPLVRTYMVRQTEDDYIFVISAHHIVCDGWSYNVIAEELAELYNRECTGAPPRLTRPKQFSEYSLDWHTSSRSDSHQEQKRYWLEQFSDLPEPIALPLDRNYPSNRTYKGATYESWIERDLYESVKKTGAKMGSTLYGTLASVYQLLFHRLTGQNDLVVCIPAAGQNVADNTDYLVGHCVNFLPLRSRFKDDQSLSDFVKNSRQTLLEATDNREFTYGELIQNIDIERDPRRMPLLELAFNVERMDYFGDWNDLNVVFEPNGKTHVHYTMFMNVVESDSGLRIDVDYNSDILDEATVASWVAYYEHLLVELTTDIERPVNQLPLISANDVECLHNDWNEHSLKGNYPNQPIHLLFEEHVKETPEQTALVDQGGSISYQTLDQRANSIATALRAENVQPQDFVAVLSSRSMDTVAALLGILKVGATYFPVDPTYPDDRIEYLLKDSGTKLVLVGEGIETPSADTNSLDLATAVQTSVPEDFSSHKGGIDDIAYCIYTSGTTGKPKGSLIPHRGVVRLVKAANYMEFGADQVFLLSATLSFDASTLELWGPLLNGGTLALLQPETTSLKDIAEAIDRFSVTSLWLTSGLFSIMVDEHPAAIAKVKQLLAGGDVLSRVHVAKALKLLGEDGRLINGYGPTENTTFTACHTITEDDLKRNSIPIGRPISHTRCYILDDNLNLVAPGVFGRLYIGGDGLATGYLNDPELTKQKFIDNPLSNSDDEVLYDSGDLCRWLQDGVIEFGGRADRQIKLRGYRIEPGEIEKALNQHPNVGKATVKVFGEGAGNKQLVGYVVAEESEQGFEASEILEFVQTRLPSYMVPTEVVVVDEFPVNANGKIDYKALPSPSLTGRVGDDVELKAPRTDTEKRLARLWHEVLGGDEPSSNQDFFKMGGHSLAGLKLFTRIYREFDIDLPLATLFQCPTIELLAKRIEERLGSDDKLNIISLISKGEPGDIPLFLVHGGDGGTLFYKDFIDRSEGYNRVYTIEAPMLVDRTISKPDESIEATANRYVTDIVKLLQPNETVAIGGYSFGGVVAQEMACQLNDLGIDVERLYLFDTNNPANESLYRLSFNECVAKGMSQLESKKLVNQVGEIRVGVKAKIKQRTTVFQDQKEINRCRRDELEMSDRLLMKLINREHLRLMLEFVPRQYDGETILFRAESFRYEFNEEMGWQELIPNLQVCEVQGKHEEIFDAGYVDVLIERFNKTFNLE